MGRQYRPPSVRPAAWVVLERALEAGLFADDLDEDSVRESGAAEDMDNAIPGEAGSRIAMPATPERVWAACREAARTLG